MDGATLMQDMVRVLLPISKCGLASTMLLSLILCWNEAFWSLNLTSSKAAPLTALIASYSSPEGLFWAKLSAVSTLACAPILIFGWISQKQLEIGRAHAELQSLMRISYAVFCLKKQNKSDVHSHIDTCSNRN